MDKVTEGDMIKAKLTRGPSGQWLANAKMEMRKWT